MEIYDRVETTLARIQRRIAILSMKLVLVQIFESLILISEVYGDEFLGDRCSGIEKDLGLFSIINWKELRSIRWILCIFWNVEQ